MDWCVSESMRGVHGSAVIPGVGVHVGVRKMCERFCRLCVHVT